MGILRRRSDGKQVVLSAETIAGRMATCGLPLDESFVSAAHALIRWNSQSWEIRDLGSRNGTFVDKERLQAGIPGKVTLGATLMFGEARETWELIDDRSPVAAAVPLDGGTPSFLALGAIPVPDAEQPWATIYLDGDKWVLETDDAKIPLEHGQSFEAGGREWRFMCPPDATSTAMLDHRLCNLDGVRLVFTVSRDEEHVQLQLKSEQFDRRLGERSAFYLAFVLARQRLNDKTTDDSEHGWIHIDSLLKMIPDYGNYAHLNVEIFRLRKLLCEAGVADAARVVERRRGQVRLGTDKIELQSPVH